MDEKKFAEASQQYKSGVRSEQITKDILDYCFSKGRYTPDYDKWFMKSEEYDEEIRDKS